MAQGGGNPVAAVAGAAAGPYLDVRDLEFAYRRGAPVLEGFSLAVERGRLACVLGPNGSGKSTLLRIIVGLLSPSKGEVRLAGIPVAAYGRGALARRIAYVPQETLAAVGFTVLETVLMGRSPHTGALGFETARDWYTAREALRLTDVEALADRSLEELSGGERQRVIVARALAQEPDVMLLDEPTAFLDIRHQHAIYGLLRALVQQRDLTVVCVSHDLNLAAAYADRLVLVSRGRVAAAGKPDDVIRSEVLSPVYETPVEIRRDDVTGRPYVLPRPPA
jgi:iron complex transport system ATP-binding protein